MRLPLLLLALAWAAPLGAQTHPFSVRDMLAMDRIGEHVVSPDGNRVLFSVRATDLAANRGRFDVWVANVDGSGARRLTSHEANDTAPAWSGDGRSAYFLSTRTGSSQVFRMPLDGGEPEQVTKLPRDVDTFRLVPGSARLVVAMSVVPGKTPEETVAHFEERAKNKASGTVYDSLFIRHWDTWADGTRNHLFVVDPATGQARDVMKAMDADAPSKPFGDRNDFTISPDGRTLVFVARDVGREEAWSTNFDLFSVPLDLSSAPTRLTTNPASDVFPVFSPDGKQLAWLAMSRPGYEADRQLVVVRDLATVSDRKLELRAGTGPRDDRSADDLSWTRDGRELLASAYHLGHRAAFALDVRSGQSRMLLSEGHAMAPQQAGSRVLLASNSLLGPVELYTVPLAAAAAVGKGAAAPALRPVTKLNAEKVAAARFGTPEQFSYEGAHGDTVYGWLVRPVDFDASKTYPLALLIHGGPQGSMGNDFHYRWNPQAYAGAGYVAVAIDFHGSTGYGQAFTDAIRHDWGGAPYEDLQKGLDHVVARYPFVDGGRACALGASYGGFMVNWIAGQPLAERFRCLVSHDGNLDERFAYLATEELWFPEWEHGSTPWDNPEGYARHNPVDHVAKWKTPMLVVHGAKDFRIPETQGFATFTALQRKGIPSKLLHFPDENHWVLKPANSLLWHETVLGWLDQWLKK
jgi:dipeptidyl aminopeptidase/acylaminoacyl peptidase